MDATACGDVAVVVFGASDIGAGTGGTRVPVERSDDAGDVVDDCDVAGSASGASISIITIAYKPTNGR